MLRTVLEVCLAHLASNHSSHMLFDHIGQQQTAGYSEESKQTRLVLTLWPPPLYL